MSSSTKKSSNKSKSSKAEKASFEKVITALEKENEAFVIPRSQSQLLHFTLIYYKSISYYIYIFIIEMMFHVASVVSAVAPVVLFWGGGSATSTSWSPVYEGRVHENLVWYLVCVVVSAVLLSHSYTSLATKTRKQLLLSRLVHCTVWYSVR